MIGLTLGELIARLQAVQANYGPEGGSVPVRLIGGDETGWPILSVHCEVSEGDMGDDVLDGVEVVCLDVTG